MKVFFHLVSGKIMETEVTEAEALEIKNRSSIELFENGYFLSKAEKTKGIVNKKLVCLIEFEYEI